MNFVADESLTGDIVSVLRAQGHNVLYIAEHSASLSDQSVLAFALERNEVLLTEDRDFGELVYQAGQPHVGIVLFRLDGMSHHEKVARAIMVVNANATRLQDSFVVVEAQKIRFGGPAQ